MRKIVIKKYLIHCGISDNNFGLKRMDVSILCHPTLTCARVAGAAPTVTDDDKLYEQEISFEYRLLPQKKSIVKREIVPR